MEFNYSSSQVNVVSNIYTKLVVEGIANVYTTFRPAIEENTRHVLTLFIQNKECLVLARLEAKGS